VNVKWFIEEIERDAGGKSVSLKHLDLTSLDSVRKFCKEIISEESRLDILVNNAGLSLIEKEMTKDNLEACMQTNHFGPFLLTHLLLGTVYFFLQNVLTFRLS